MTDNRQTREAAIVREKSEFIKRIEDFARYMQKEYIEDCEGRSLLISAGDRSIDGPRGGMIHIMLGDRTLTTAALASMMQQRGMSDVFRMARIASVIDDDTDDVISKKRQRLRIFYGIAALAAFWTLCNIGFLIVGISNWITTVSNLLLLTYVGFLLYREIRPLRRQIVYLKAARHEEQEARMKHRIATFFDEIIRRAQQDDEE